MRRAVIDIGSNTVKLLVADVAEGMVVPVFEADVTTRLGEGLVAQSSRLWSSSSAEQTASTETLDLPRLSRIAIARTVQAVAQFLDAARVRGAADVIALTTSAARDAANRNEFLDGVRCKCGLEVQVISGAREAELIFRGVASDPVWAGEPLLVMDVGGGSAELVQGKDGAVDNSVSIPVGAVRLTERFGDEHFEALGEFVREILAGSLAGYSLRGRRLIGTGGSITTLARVLRAGRADSRRSAISSEAFDDSIDHAMLSLGDLSAVLAKLRALPLAERRRVPGLPADRADIIVAGGAVFVVAMEVLGAAQLTVSTRNLRFGILGEPR